MGRTPKKKSKRRPRSQPYWYTDDAGVRHYKSFTGDTKKEAQRKADEWKLTQKDKEPKADEQKQPKKLTIEEAIQAYIDVKTPSLSPATVRGYKKDLRSYFSDEIGKVCVVDIDSQTVQLWIGQLVKRGLSPKSIRNGWGLLRATLEMFAPDIHLHITLPAPKKKDFYCPNDNDIKSLLKAVSGTEMELAVLLAAFGPLRRGEVCALTSDDIKGNIIYVRHSIVEGPNKEWIVKQPKNPGSYRRVEYPDFVIEKLNGRKGKLVDLMPNQISKTFKNILSENEIPVFRFHDLRHYGASIMHAIGVPDQYIMQRGGWSSDGVMKRVYRNIIDEEAKKQTQKIIEHFTKLQDV